MEFYHKLIKILSFIAILLTVFLVCFLFCQIINESNIYYINLDYLVNLKKILNAQKQEQFVNTLPIQFKKTESINLLFFGDMMLDRHVKEVIEQNGIDYLFKNFYPEGDILECRLQGAQNGHCFFNNYDLISANLEGAVTNNGEHYPPIVDYDFAFAPELIMEINKKYNFNFFNLANNHFYDQGERGIIETRDNLDQLNLNYSGCRDGRIDDCSSSVIEINDMKIGIAGFSMVYSKLDIEELKEEASQLASITDLVIVNMHWGIEYEHDFNQLQQEVAHNLINAGADIIIGHHPHVVQGIELYNNSIIFYSLGNFIFDQYFSPDTQEGLGVGLTILNERLELDLYPFKSNLSRVELIDENEKADFFTKLASWSEIDKNLDNQIKQGKIITQIYE